MLACLFACLLACLLESSSEAQLNRVRAVEDKLIRLEMPTTLKCICRCAIERGKRTRGTNRSVESHRLRSDPSLTNVTRARGSTDGRFSRQDDKTLDRTPERLTSFRNRVSCPFACVLQPERYYHCVAITGKAHVKEWKRSNKSRAHTRIALEKENKIIKIERR